MHVLILGRGRHGRPQAHRATAARRPSRQARYHPPDAAGRGRSLQNPAKAPIPVKVVASDFADRRRGRAALIAERPDVIFHLAAIVSGEAEVEFDKGYRINLDGTRYLIDAIRARRRRLQAAAGVHLVDRRVRRAVPGKDRRRVLPHAADQLRHAEGDLRTPDQRLHPQGLARRHQHPPADDLRAARASRTRRRPASSPTSSANRWRAQEAVLPVSEDVQPLARLAAIGGRLPRCMPAPWTWRAIGPAPQLSACPACPPPSASRSQRSTASPARRCVARIKRVPDPAIISIVSGWPRNFDHASAREKLGFTTAETTFDDIIRIHIEDELGGKFAN